MQVRMLDYVPGLSPVLLPIRLSDGRVRRFLLRSVLYDSSLSQDSAGELGAQQNLRLNRGVKYILENGARVDQTEVSFTEWPLPLVEYEKDIDTLRHVDGILGFNMLRHSALEIDYSRGTVEWIDPDTLDNPETSSKSMGVISVPIDISQKRTPIVDVVVDGTSTKWELNLGAPISSINSVAFPGPISPEKRVRVLDQGPNRVDVDLARMRRITVGSAVWERPVVLDTSRSSGAEKVNTLSADFLGLFRTVVDFEHGRLHLFPRTSSIRHVHPGFGVGWRLRLMRSELPEVVRIVVGSPAEQAGVRLGDKVRTVNGKTLKGLGPVEQAKITNPTTSATLSVTLVRSGSGRVFSVRVRPRDLL
jgi:hypothetical protein